MAIISSPLVLIKSVPPVARAVTAATVVSSVSYGWFNWNGVGPDAARYMLLVPGTSIFTPWTFITSLFVEPTIPEFLATLLFVPAGLRYLERLWGSVETVKFILVSVVTSNIIAFGFNWIEYFVTGKADLFLYEMGYHGQMALQISILVAFTQLIPEHQVQILGVIKTRVKSLPMAYLTLSSVMCFIGFQCPWIVIQFGWYVSWVYLRFYKKNSADSVGGVDIYGDRSETFSLVSWFPLFMHYPLRVGGDFVHSLATRLHLIPSIGEDVESGVYTQVPGSARAEAERRRAMALKALDHRLASSSLQVGSHSGSTPQPNGSATSSQESVAHGHVDNQADGGKVPPAESS